MIYFGTDIEIEKRKARGALFCVSHHTLYAAGDVLLLVAAASDTRGFATAIPGLMIQGPSA